ncbi:MAG: hypothetical protein AAGI38_14275 [Bacteroidota bacterium]
MNKLLLSLLLLFTTISLSAQDSLFVNGIGLSKVSGDLIEVTLTYSNNLNSLLTEPRNRQRAVVSLNYGQPFDPEIGEIESFRVKYEDGTYFTFINRL